MKVKVSFGRILFTTIMPIILMSSEVKPDSIFTIGFIWFAIVVIFLRKVKIPAANLSNTTTDSKFSEAIEHITDSSRDGINMGTLVWADEIGRKIKIIYENAKGEESEREITIYISTINDDYLYLHGFCSLRNEFRSFRLDRIVEIFEHNTRINKTKFIRSLKIKTNLSDLT